MYIIDLDVLWRVKGGRHHDEHVVERLQLDVLPQYAAQDGDDLLELHLVRSVPRPGGSKPLLVLQEILFIWS